MQGVPDGDPPRGASGEEAGGGDAMNLLLFGPILLGVTWVVWLIIEAKWTLIVTGVIARGLLLARRQESRLIRAERWLRRLQRGRGHARLVAPHLWQDPQHCVAA
jgi:hypothetical protein